MFLVYIVTNVIIRVRIPKEVPDQASTDEEPNENRNNTNSYNTEAVSVKFMLLTAIVGTLAGISANLGNNVEHFNGDLTRMLIYFIGDITHPLIQMVLVPTLVLLDSPRLRQYISETLKSIHNFSG